MPNGSAGTVQTSAGGKGAATSTAYRNTAAGKTASGDMYAGHDGNVYKNTGSGWQKYDNGSWNTVSKPTTASAQSYEQQHTPQVPVEVTPVGKYALKFKWTDGHESGIYSWEYLRRVCQCAECKAKN